MDINTYIRENRQNKNHVRIVECADGFTMSVQASPIHYCSPRDMADEYTEVEVGFPNMEESLLMPYCEDTNKPTDTVYAYVPVEVVDSVIEKHGGLDFLDFA